MTKVISKIDQIVPEVSELSTDETGSSRIFYPAQYYVTYVTVPAYDIDQDTESAGALPSPASNSATPSTGGAASVTAAQATPIMASAAVEPSSSMVEHHAAYHHGGGEPIFTSSDLPLQPYPHLTPMGAPTPPLPSGSSGSAVPPTVGGVGGVQPTDLFVNPAFAHMSFLPDGSMVGPSGEMYSPAEYFPSLLVESSQVPAVIPVSPQPGEYPVPSSGTPPPGVGKT